jgi:hypothetical protein
MPIKEKAINFLRAEVIQYHAAHQFCQIDWLFVRGRLRGYLCPITQSLYLGLTPTEETFPFFISSWHCA